MDAWVINLDDQPQRWEAVRKECGRVGLFAHRFSATPDTGQVEPPWRGRKVPDISRRQAIATSYRRLLDHLETDAANEWLILQDDVTIRIPPDPPKSSRIHIFGGWRMPYLEQGMDGVWRPVPYSMHLADPHITGHIHPMAFYLHRDLLADLAACWKDTSRQVCETWIPLLREHATFEPQPTIEQANI